MPTTATAQEKPHIVVIWGDDVGQSNLSIYTRGMMGYQTPNIDRIATDGMLFTDYDGYNLLPMLTGQTSESPRKEFFYFSDDGDLTGLRYDNWKVVFAQQRAAGTLNVWSEPYTFTRIPWLFNLRTDPYEKATLTSNTYWDWYIDRAYLLLPASDYVANFLATFQEFPPRQKAASFTIDQVLEKLQPPTG